MTIEDFGRELIDYINKRIGEEQVKDLLSPPPLNARIVFTENTSPKFISGKIYDIINGKIKSEDGCVYPTCDEFMTLKDLAWYFAPDEPGSEPPRPFKGNQFSNDGIKYVVLLDERGNKS